jgi:hypothetical protein
VNPWVLGNVVIGGIPGLVVDNATGAAWRPRRSEIHTQLMPMGAPGQGPMFSSSPAPQDSAQSPQYVADRTSEAVSPSDKHSAAGTGATY